MIKITDAKYLDGYRIRLTFSDGMAGDMDFSSLVAKEGSMVLPLRDQAFFQDCHLELGALCWRNGMELSAGSLYQQLEEQGLLHQAAA